LLKGFEIEMTGMSLKQKIIRLAFTHPELRGALAPVLKKIAIAQETSDFIEWAMNTQQPMSPSEVTGFLGVLGIDVQNPVQRRKGPRYRVGDRIEIIAKKHKDSSSRQVYDEFDGKIGTVVGIDGDDVLVKLDSGSTKAPVRFPLGMKARGVGMYKHTDPYTIEGSHKVEIIYLAGGGNTTSDQQFVVNNYLSRARGPEKRSANYYTGHITQARYNKQGEIYFLAFPQQRVRVDPKSEAGFLPRAFNATKGQILYIGLADKRPSGWINELKDIQIQNSDIGLLANL